MGRKYSYINQKFIQFIKEQKVFFVATAANDGKVNLSPKGEDSLRVIDKNRVIWLNLTGSGNETAAHVQNNNRMTLMFCAFAGKPMILRLYGTAQVVHPQSRLWEELKNLFPNMLGTRQFFDMKVELVQSSCGMGVPLFDYVEQRNMLEPYWEKRSPEKLSQYWKEKNETSIDGKPIKMK